MNDTATTQQDKTDQPSRHKSKSAIKIRFVTATSLFDGHDAAINIMRRILQASGAEVIHLGHNRSVDEVVTAAIQEDVQGIAISSYQGGHVEYFKYAVDLLHERGAGRIKLFGGGGGVITRDEMDDLHAYGVERLYSPADGQRMSLQGMIDDMMERADFDPADDGAVDIRTLATPGWRPLARFITRLEHDRIDAATLAALSGNRDKRRKMPVVGITGTGGSGKSSLCDELIRRFRLDSEEFKIAVLAIDPSKRKSGGALLGDRIRMNAINAPQIYMRSIATRDSGSEVPEFVPAAVEAARAAGFDLVIVETPGIGQGNTAIADLADISLYVMTPEFGAASQLEKIDMLDFADLVAINKFDRRGAEDALRDVRKQVQRNRQIFDKPPNAMPVYGAIAARFQDDGVTGLYLGLRDQLAERGFDTPPSRFEDKGERVPSPRQAIVPPMRSRYLAEIAAEIRNYHSIVAEQARLAREIQQLKSSRQMLEAEGASGEALDPLIAEREERVDPRARKLIENWPKVRERYSGDDFVVKVRDREVRTRQVSISLSGTPVRKVALPRYEDHGELLRWILRENVPGAFPYTAGVFSFKREGEDPTRMFAGEGDPFRTNARFKFLSKDSDAKRLSTAFDSVTLYGWNPDERPDIYGKVGNSGVSIATLDDMKALYAGFDLCLPSTSVSMTINGPAPMLLAMFFNTAIDQQLAKFAADHKRQPTLDEASRIRAGTLETV
ncbi:MAG TPA: methylmalonyl-CoA mutase family protein, partial [Rhizomicrobium sp.]